MKLELLNYLKCPDCNSSFIIRNEEYKNDEVSRGEIFCESCAKSYKIDNYIPRFVETGNYSQSWFELWKNTYQYIRDSYTGCTFYYDTLFGEWNEGKEYIEGKNMFGFNWDKGQRNKLILEIGPGSGCCTEHLIKTGAKVIVADMSDSIDLLSEDIILHENCYPIQLDINSNILRQNLFDKIWFFQVLQHTPNPSQTLKCVYNYLKEGGEISFTSYANKFYPWWWKFTVNKSYKWVYRFVKVFLPIKYYGLKFISFTGFKFLEKIWNAIFLPVDPRNVYFNTLSKREIHNPVAILYNKTRDKKMLFNQTVLNTHDRITPEYTNGADHDTIKKWTEEAGFKNIRIWGKSGVRVKADR